MPRCAICHNAATKDHRVELTLRLRGIRTTTFAAHLCSHCFSKAEVNSPIPAARAAVEHGKVTKRTWRAV